MKIIITGRRQRRKLHRVASFAHVRLIIIWQLSCLLRVHACPIPLSLSLSFSFRREARRFELERPGIVKVRREGTSSRMLDDGERSASSRGTMSTISLYGVAVSPRFNKTLCKN